MQIFNLPCRWIHIRPKKIIQEKSSMRCKFQSTVFRKISFLSQQKPSKPSLTPTKNHLKRQCNWPMDCYLTSFMESRSGIRWETEGGVPLSVRARMQSCIQYINYSVKKLAGAFRTVWGIRHGKGISPDEEVLPKEGIPQVFVPRSGQKEPPSWQGQGRSPNFVAC